MQTVEFLFDFGSPNAYLSHRIVPEIEARSGAKFVYTPVLLGGLFKLTGNQSPMAAFGHIPNKMDYENLEMRRFIARHGLTQFQMNPHFPVNTLQIMRGAVAAQVAGVFEPYIHQVCADMWERGRKMDDPAVIRGSLEEAGLPAEELIALSQSAEVKATLMANTERAAARGAFGIPTFFVGEEIFFGKDKLRDVEDELARHAV